MRLILEPSDTVTINLIYYHFRLDNPDQSFGLVPSRVDRDLADEFDLIVDWTLTNWWSFTFDLSVAHPNQGFRQAVDGNKNWFNGYIYTNFNF